MKTVRRAATLLVFVTLFASISAVAAWAAPANDDFASAETIGGSPFLRDLDTSGATEETGEPTPSCPILSMPTGATVWFRFAPDEPMRVDADTFGSKYDTVLAAYRGDSLDALSEVACNDDWEITGSQQSKLTFFASSGQDYYLQVGGFNGAAGSLKLKVTSAITVANDEPANAIEITSVPFTHLMSTVNASTGDDDPWWCYSTGRTVWYRYHATTAAGLIVDTFGSEYDTVLSAYRGVPSADSPAIACNDDYESTQSKISFSMEAGEEYYIEVASYSDEGGNLTLNVAVLEPPPNDDLADAIEITSIPFTDTRFTGGSTIQDGEPQCDDLFYPVEYGSSIWYRYTTDSVKPLYLDTFRSDFYAAVNVFKGTAINDLAPVDCEDGNEAGFIAQPGTTYFIQVAAWPGEAGIAVLHVTNGAHAGADALVAGAAISAGADDKHQSAAAWAGAPLSFAGVFADHDADEEGAAYVCAGVVIGTCEGIGLPPGP